MDDKEVSLDLLYEHLMVHEQPPRVIRVVVADGHALIREGIKMVLSADPDLVLAGESADLPGTLDVVQATRPDVLLLDLSLSPTHELDALRTVTARFPGMPVLILSAHSEAQFGIAALRLGAAGYISKSQNADVIVPAIRKAHAGGRYLSDALAQLLAEGVASSRPRHAHERLTEREHQVLHLLAMGRPVKQVADMLGISVSSVNTYRHRVLDKLGTRSNAELIRYAIQHGLVS
jgi:DNA-binding NarL/FixJ family response regulator